MTCICVLGMHRSGTSCLTGIMQQLGTELGEVFTENLHNRKGNRENGRIVTLNEALLQFNKGTWNRPVVVQQWTLAHAAERDAIIAALLSRNSEFWGFKDTRTLFTLPFWLEALEQPRFIGTFRHPQRVALSLQQRDGSPIGFGHDLWLRYNRRLLALAQAGRIPLIDFDQDDAAYLKDVMRKLASIGLDPEHTGSQETFFDPRLRNQTEVVVDTATLPDPIRQLYADLQQQAKQS